MVRESLKKAPKLPETEEDLEKATEPVKVDATVDTEGDGEQSGDSTSEYPDETGEAARQRLLQARARHRIRLHLAEALEGASSNMTLLEKRAITARVTKYYQNELEQVLKFADLSDTSLVSDAEVDGALVAYFNRCYFAGEQSDKGEKVLAALLHYAPEFGRNGGRFVPRAWRAVKGWRKLTPPRSRLGLPLGVWAAIAWRMMVHNELPMATYMLLMVSSYARPNELLRIQRRDLVPPSPRVVDCWSLVLNARELGKESKVGTYDDSILLNSSWLGWLGPVLKLLKEGEDEGKVFQFTYPQFLKVFGRVLSEFCLHGVVPYQARHSGPSIDRAKGERSLLEVQKRGRWASSRSLVRYERAARLSKSWHALTSDQRTLFKLCEDQLEAIILGRPITGMFLPTSGR